MCGLTVSAATLLVILLLVLAGIATGAVVATRQSAAESGFAFTSSPSLAPTSDAASACDGTGECCSDAKQCGEGQSCCYVTHSPTPKSFCGASTDLCAPMSLTLEPVPGEGFRFTTTIGGRLNVLVDTGSSTLALCWFDSFPAGATALADAYACAAYGTGAEGFIGPVYSVSSISWGNSALSGVTVAQMSTFWGDWNWTACDNEPGVGIQGIFGLGNLDAYFHSSTMPTEQQCDDGPDYIYPSAYPSYPLQTVGGYHGTFGIALTSNYGAGTPNGVILTESFARNFASAFGALVGTTPLLQTYGGSSLVSYYVINLVTGSGTAVPTILDSGTENFQLSSALLSGQIGTSLKLGVASPTSSTTAGFTLSFGVDEFASFNQPQLNAAGVGPVAEVTSSEPVILGLPLWAFYYVLVDVESMTVSFYSTSTAVER